MKVEHYWFLQVYEQNHYLIDFGNCTNRLFNTLLRDIEKVNLHLDDRL